MPKFKFGDSDNYQEELPAGNYIAKVIEVNSAISDGPKTSGFPMLECKLKFYDKDMQPVALWTERLVFGHKPSAWRIDTFLKCMNFNEGNLQENDEVEVERETIIGLQGWVKTGHRIYKKDGEDKKANQVETWLTDRPKLPRDASFLKDSENPF